MAPLQQTSSEQTPKDVSPFRVEIPEGELTELRERLQRTRWPEAETVDDWSQGIPLEYAQELCRYWADGYDWRATEARLNGLPQFRTEIDGLGIHFLHVRSPHPDALPLLITHGWPGSIVEFLKVIEPLADPPVGGGDPADAFHVVSPSLPGGLAFRGAKASEGNQGKGLEGPRPSAVTPSSVPSVHHVPVPMGVADKEST